MLLLNRTVKTASKILRITIQGFSLRFIDCPGEVHLQNGLVFYEENRGIFFSCDLMQRFGDAAGKIIVGNWKDKLDAIGPERIRNAEKLLTLQENLHQLTPGLLPLATACALDAVRKNNSTGQYKRRGKRGRAFPAVYTDIPRRFTHLYP